MSALRVCLVATSAAGEAVPTLQVVSVEYSALVRLWRERIGNMEYATISKWCGWLGGWGSEEDITKILDNMAVGGWRLVRTESK